MESILYKGTMKAFQEVVLSLFEEYESRLVDTLSIDKDLRLSQNQVSYEGTDTIQFSISSVPMIKSTTPLDKHYFASAIRREYFGEIQPYHFQFAKLGYSKQDSVLEAFSCPEHHYFTHYCSPFPDVHSGSLGRFEDFCKWEQFDVVYVIPPFSDPEYIRMLLPTIENCAKYTAVVLIVPAVEDVIKAIEDENGLSPSILREKNSRTSMLIDRQTKKEIYHVEYYLGKKFHIEKRRVLTQRSTLNEEETRLFGLYSTFVYETVYPLSFDNNHPLTIGPELGIIKRDSSILSSFLMSYLGGSYYTGMEALFEQQLYDGYQYFEFIQSPISLQMVNKWIDEQPEQAKKCLSSCPDALDIREDLYTGKDWISFYKETDETKLEKQKSLFDYSFIY
jgi:hypothetical protein